MGIPLRVLNVEDSEDDARLLLRHLSRAGYDVTFERVDTPEGLEAALDARQWDILVTDYVLPHFSGPAAVALSRERDPNLPVVLLSGAIRADQLETEALEAGAHDYLVKTNLGRFVPAIALAAGVLTGAEQADAHLMLSREYLGQPSPSPAKATLHATLALVAAEQQREPSSFLMASALLSLGICHVRSRKYDDAIAVLGRFRALQPLMEPRAAVLQGEAAYQLAIALEEVGDHTSACTALTEAREDFDRLRLVNRAADCQAILDRIRADSGSFAVPDRRQPVATLPADRWALHLEQAEYHLYMGDAAQAVREAISALHLVEGDSLRCYDCYMMLLRCANIQGHRKDALNFALSARIMALEAGRHDLAYQPTTVFHELLGNGEEAKALLTQLEGEYQRWGLDMYRYLPADLKHRR